MYFLYSLLLVAWGVLLLPFFLYRSRRRGRRLEGIAERFGRLPASVGPSDKGVIWFHSCSVGETLSLEPLVQALRARLPGAAHVFSTVTPTGRRVAADRFGAGGVFYFPVDFAFVVRRVLDRIQPAAIVIIDTEIWPNLLHAAKRRGIPVVLVNGRISPSSFPWYRRARPLFRHVLWNYEALLMQSPADAERILAMGAPRDRVRVTGNLKFDREVPDSALLHDFEKDFLAGAGPLIVAGSTHPGEEAQLLATLAALRGTPGHAECGCCWRRATRSASTRPPAWPGRWGFQSGAGRGRNRARPRCSCSTPWGNWPPSIATRTWSSWGVRWSAMGGTASSNPPPSAGPSSSAPAWEISRRSPTPFSPGEPCAGSRRGRRIRSCSGDNYWTFFSACCRMQGNGRGWGPPPEPSSQRTAAPPAVRPEWSPPCSKNGEEREERLDGDRDMQIKEQIRRTLAGLEPRTLTQGFTRQAAVLIPVFEYGGEHHLLLTRRTDQVETHKGQISFPGGMREEGENLMRTALRETYEEVGVAEDRVEILGRFHDYMSITDYRVTPFAGFLHAPFTVRRQEREVAEVLRVPLETFLDPGRLRTENEIWGEQPVKAYYYSYGAHQIWGLTARIIKEFFDTLRLPPPHPGTH